MNIYDHLVAQHVTGIDLIIINGQKIYLLVKVSLSKLCCLLGYVYRWFLSKFTQLRSQQPVLLFKH